MTKYVNDNGVSEIWTNTKNYISAQLLGKSDVGHTHSASDITSGLSTVATSGSYNDLSNKPTIPTVNNATLTIQKNGTTVKTFTANASSNVTANITVPTKTSDLTNDSGFITSAVKEEGSIVDSGWCLVYGDLLIQRGSTIFHGQNTFTFGKPFAEKPSVVINYGDPSNNSSPCALLDSYVTSTHFTATNGGGVWRCNWIAIGKKGY